MASNYDVIVLGAGSTGGALAARLSEHPDRRVLVLEGGPVYSAQTEIPPELLSPSSIAAGAPGHPNNWGYMGELRTGFRLPYPRGRGMGGSSSINGCYFIRGTRQDFDDWVGLGNDEWGFDAVLDSFRRSEQDYDFTDDAHGTDGPIPVMREPKDRLPKFTGAFEQGCFELGFQDDPDKNAPDSKGGVGPVPLNIARGRRVGTALGYLLPAAHRANLTILGNAVARRVLVDDGRAVGVEAVVDGRLEVFRGAEIVVCTGALRTPHLLMVSGLGPAQQLRQYGVEVVQDLPGVGQNLTDHSMISAAWEADMDLPKYTDRGVLTSAVHWNDEGSELEILPFVAKTGDMMSAANVLERPAKAISALRGTSIKAVTRQAKSMRHAMLAMVVLQQSSRGEVTLASGKPEDMPRIQWNLTADARDRRRLRAAARMAWELFDTSAMRDIGASIVGLNTKTVSDDNALDKWAAERISAGHPSCTVRMGPESDSTAVVDQRLRVYGVDGLRVADTSIFPTIPSRGPNATAIMLGERLAELMNRETN